MAISDEKTSSRDRQFLGLHAPPERRRFDVYGTLQEKTLRLPADLLVRTLTHARAQLHALLHDLPNDLVWPVQPVPRPVASTNPPLWTLGHVAFFYESTVLDILFGQEMPPELQLPGAKAAAALTPTSSWRLFDSARIFGAERYRDKGATPENIAERRKAVELYAAAIHETMTQICCMSSSSSEEGLLFPIETYVLVYAAVHEYWHIEDMWYTRMLLHQPPPLQADGAPFGARLIGAVPTHQYTCTAIEISADAAATTIGSEVQKSREHCFDMYADVLVSLPQNTWMLGASQKDGWAFDSEKWQHPVHVRPFNIRRTPVTNAEFAQFVAAKGYEEESFWSLEGWRWRQESKVQAPLYWSRKAEPPSGVKLKDEEPWRDWDVQHFNKVYPLAPRLPVAHVSWYEAEAYCRWAKRRLPTEAEWEAAALGSPTQPSDSSQPSKLFPWGNGALTTDVPEGEQMKEGVYGAHFPLGVRANVDAASTAPVAVDEFSLGDSAWGCRQCCGNVWEWTATTFLPFPGYVMDFPYREQSVPFFMTSKVAKGGSWATSALTAYTKYRNFFAPGGRREVAVGFRTCSLE